MKCDITDIEMQCRACGFRSFGHAPCTTMCKCERCCSYAMLPTGRYMASSYVVPSAGQPARDARLKARRLSPVCADAASSPIETFTLCLPDEQREALLNQA